MKNNLKIPCGVVLYLDFPERENNHLRKLAGIRRYASVRQWEVQTITRRELDRAAVKDEDAHLWEMEFTAETEDGAKKAKLVVPEGFNHALAHPKVSAPSFCLFARSELGKGRIRFTATPINCFGARGAPLSISVGGEAEMV